MDVQSLATVTKPLDHGVIHKKWVQQLKNKYNFHLKNVGQLRDLQRTSIAGCPFMNMRILPHFAIFRVQTEIYLFCCKVVVDH